MPLSRITNPFLNVSGAVNANIASPSANTIAFTTAATERMRIDSAGNIGIGTASPSQKLEVYAASGTLQIQSVVRNDNTGSGVAAIGFNVAGSAGGEATSTKAGIGLVRTNAFGVGSLCFYNANTASANNFTTADERMRIDQSGNMGIGTNSPSYRLDIVGAGSPANGIVRSSSNFTNSATKYGYYTVGHYTNATAPFGFIQGESNSTENNVHIGGGAGEVTAATRIDFYTAANNTTVTGTERMRIDSGGTWMLNTTDIDAFISSSTSQTGFSFRPGLGARLSLINDFYINRSNGDGGIFNFRRNGTTVGSVSVSSGATAYTTSSDYRLKQDITPMTGALTKVSLLKPVTYKWKSDDSDGEGFIAHELAEVCPNAVIGVKDAVDENDKPVYQGIDSSFLIATLTAAIQELKVIVDAQAVEIAALKANQLSE